TVVPPGHAPPPHKTCKPVCEVSHGSHCKKQHKCKKRHTNHKHNCHNKRWHSCKPQTWKKENCNCKPGGGEQLKGNNGVSNGLDSQPPGNPPVNDGVGTSTGNPGNKG